LRWWILKTVGVVVSFVNYELVLFDLFDFNEI